MPITFAEFPQFLVLDHPLIQHKLSMMRDKTTPTILFRQLLREIALLMGYEITRNLPMTTVKIETPLAPMDAPSLAGKKVAVVPILRAGLVMAEGLLELIPPAVGHIGLYKSCDQTPVEYFCKAAGSEDARHPGRPMLATGYLPRRRSTS
jgi:uracil phosphoribosyltransferase